MMHKYPWNFSSNTLGLDLALPEIGNVAIELCRVFVLIEATGDSKEFFVGAELIPAASVVEGIVVSWEVGSIVIRLPGSKHAFTAMGGLFLADDCVGSEGYGEMKNAPRSIVAAYYRHLRASHQLARKYMSRYWSRR
jgi:hypothetical protein